jgi:hypothetical protein
MRLILAGQSLSRGRLLRCTDSAMGFEKGAVVSSNEKGLQVIGTKDLRG